MIIHFFLSMLSLGVASINNAKISNIFVVHHGLDDNDEVSFVMDIQIPNACYKLSSPILNFKNQTFSLEQPLIRRNIPGCNIEDDKLPDYLNFSSTLTKVVNLGQLDAGNYFIFNSNNPMQKMQNFIVHPGSNQSMDDFFYAPLTHNFVKEINYSNEEVMLILSGTLESSCFSLDSNNINIERQENVFVIRPLMNYRKIGGCKDVKRSTQNIVSLGILEEGRYMVHIRTYAGGSDNLVFTVIKNNIL